MTYNWKKFIAGNLFSIFLIKNCNLLIYPWASIKDAQATGEAVSPQKRTSSTLKHENSGFFSIFVGHFCPPGSGSGSANIQYFKTWKFWIFFYFCGSFLPSWIRIRIRNLNADPDLDPATQINADPCGSGSETLVAPSQTSRQYLTFTITLLYA